MKSDEVSNAFAKYLDRKPTEEDLHLGFTFACGYAAGEEAARNRRELKLREPSEEIKKYMDGVVGVLEANSFETLSIWKMYNTTNEAKGTFDQERNGGYLVYVARSEDGSVVTISLSRFTFNGMSILVYSDESEIVDHSLIDQWIEKYAPPTAWKNGRLNKTNATNHGNL